MDFLFDLYQQGKINQATNKADRAKEKADLFQDEINDLKRKADALTIACQALWELVQSQSGLSDDVILGKIQEIDARDGSVDGKISVTLAMCPRCGRGSNAARKWCLYCGEPLPVQHVFGRK